MRYDAEATRARLLDAALTEFSAYGIAGARVDRIATAAGSNKAQIYHYFGSKDQLFDAAFESIVTTVVSSTPLDVHDLPGYAARLAELYDAHPAIMRMASWQRLERPDDEPVKMSVDSVRHKIDEIARAQADGVLPDHYPAGVLLTLVLHVASVWATATPEFSTAVEVADADRARHVADAVGRLLGQ
ncbi:TetR family transcriptional regulator [Streptomyces sp. NPDC001928]|uniref:TetR/AcrR family transcriptional regulator n=1 Tax=Streptomyces sp. NPDC001928 TaxID=3154404 RepID=UPI003333DF5A